MISHLKIARGYDRAGCVGTWALQQKKKQINGCVTQMYSIVVLVLEFTCHIGENLPITV